MSAFEDVFVFETFTHKRNLALGFASVGESRDFGTEKSFAPQLVIFHFAGSQALWSMPASMPAVP
jgi:hypothetical protein